MRWKIAGRNRQSWGHASLDLCLGMLVASLTIVFASRLPLIGPTAAVLLAPALEFSPHVPAPPPKLAALF
jgi:hypothetical protein